MNDNWLILIFMVIISIFFLIYDLNLIIRLIRALKYKGEDDFLKLAKLFPFRGYSRNKAAKLAENQKQTKLIAILFILLLSYLFITFTFRVIPQIVYVHYF